MVWEIPSARAAPSESLNHRGVGTMGDTGDTFQVGDVILDRYEVTAILGKGGMGVVLAAHDREFGQLVALKFLLSSHCDRPEVAERFIQEARTGRRINNPHVAQVYDVKKLNGAPFIVMEHLSGQDLAAEIRQRGQDFRPSLRRCRRARAARRYGRRSLGHQSPSRVLRAGSSRSCEVGAKDTGDGARRSLLRMYRLNRDPRARRNCEYRR